MEYSYEFHKGYAEVKIFGLADLPVYKDFITALLSSEELSPGMPVLLDQTELVAGHITADELKTIAKLCIRLKDSIGSRKVAVRSRQDALDWLKT